MDDRNWNACLYEGDKMVWAHSGGFAEILETGREAFDQAFIQMIFRIGFLSAKDKQKQNNSGGVE
jgi:hypothetical protein